jgi:DNA-binding response OmpR family regulator
VRLVAAILLVEDDESLRLALADNLEAEGHAVEVAADGAAARALFGAKRFDLLVLDVMLPDTDGYTLAREVRAARSPARILMLTARTLEDDLVRGFEAGADDYLEKPYRLRELLARVKALLRRGAEPVEPEVLSLPGFSLDLPSRRVVREGGGEVELTKTEFELLAYFLRKRGQALSRDQILDAVWGEGIVVDERTVDNFVLSLKKKLGWSSASGFAFRAIRGVGYRFEVE